MAIKKEVFEAVDDVKEYLALNKWSEAMQLMAQVSVGVIENLTDEALIVSKGYEQDLKTLLAAGIINDATCHNLETLIISGIQARNGVDIPSEYAKKALTVLEDELKVVFNDDVKVGETDRRGEKALAKAEMNNESGFMYDETEEDGGEEDVDDDTPVFINKNGDVDFRVKERLRNESLNKKVKVNKKSIVKLFAIIIPIVLIIAVAVLVRSCMKNNVDDKRNAVRTRITEIPTVEEIIETTEETEPPTTSEAGMYIVTGDRVWIRDQANTTSSHKLAGVDKGDQVRVIKFYDDKWAIVNYDGKEAFISRQYIYRADDQSVIEQETSEEAPVVNNAN